MIALVFPGQGSQKKGMGEDLLGVPEYKDLLERAEALLPGLAEAMDDEELIVQTLYAQPAVFSMSCGILGAWDIDYSEIACVAGHSLGQYSALVAAGVLDFDTGLQLVSKRAMLMSQAAKRRPGTMAAVIGLDRDTVKLVVEETRGAVVANHNSYEQTVISGTREGVGSASELLMRAGAKRVIPLSVEGAFHSPLMEYASEEFLKSLGCAPFKETRTSFIGNTTGRSTTNLAKIEEDLQKQMLSPVKWHETLMTMKGLHLTAAVEIGPGNVLSGLIRKTLPNLPVYRIGSLEELDQIRNSDIGHILRRR